MENMKKYSGSRWYKCDLHLHTMCSPCYTEKTDTPARWVSRAIEQGLNVAAVTDHNDYRGIKAIVEESKKQGLIVFPGVEVTCDSSKIHILVLFNTDKNEDTVRDFLNRCDIDSECVGESGGTTLSVTEVCQIARKRGALVIAAHIDEFSSISSMNPSSLDKLLNSGLLDAVQVVNVPFWEKYGRDKDAESMYAALKEEYGPDATPEEIERWRKCYDRAREAGLPMVSFSDNPREPGTGNHGLWGIGNVYTWIQMSDSVDLESLRQALISPENRIRTFFESKEKPQAEPDFWIRSLEVRNSLLNPHLPIHLDFHPQLNCIIGGRGSGKSSVVTILKGVYGQLLGTEAGQDDLVQYRSADDSTASKPGLFREDSEIDLTFYWFGTLYRMIVRNIQDTRHQDYQFYRIDPENNRETEEDLTNLKFRSLMSAQVFAQREINEISRNSGKLLRYIDSLIDDMYILQAKKQYFLEQLINCSQKQKSEEQIIRFGYRISAELEWFHMISGMDNISPETKKELPDMIARRNSASEMIDDGMENLRSIEEERDKFLKKYEETLAEIHRMRTSYITAVLKEDQNYKIELKAMGDRESFRQMLKQYLGKDVTLLNEDVETLEAALFAKKEGLKKYQLLISNIRKRSQGKKAEEISGISSYFVHLIGMLNETDYEYVHLFHPEDELCLFYHPTGIMRFFPMENASSGERATAMFSFFLQSNSVPLVIDQPETDMDNHGIYAEILAKISRAKQNRQLILTTHNSILTVNSDPGMVIVMDAASKFVRVKAEGTMDSPEIRKEICDIIEGSETAFVQRARKYNIH